MESSFYKTVAAKWGAHSRYTVDCRRRSLPCSLGQHMYYTHFVEMLRFSIKINIKQHKTPGNNALKHASLAHTFN